MHVSGDGQGQSSISESSKGIRDGIHMREPRVRKGGRWEVNKEKHIYTVYYGCKPASSPDQLRSSSSN
jgi:hypothetical protein